MLRLMKRHGTKCTKTETFDLDCKPKTKGTWARCPFYIVGPHPTNPSAPKIQKNLKTADRVKAEEALRDFDRSFFQATPEPTARARTSPLPTTPPSELDPTLEEALEHFLLTKKRKSSPRQKKLRLQLSRMVTYLLTTYNRQTIREVQKTDLECFMDTWTGEQSTLKTTRENMKGFWRYCYNSEFMTRNVAVALPTIEDRRADNEREDPPTFDHDEITAILNTARGAANGGKLFKREGLNVARQVFAFTLVEKYTGMAIGDVAKLRLSELDGNNLQVNRKKTGERVYTAVPQFVVDALHSFKTDSQNYFFWSGEGKPHTRTTKWGSRLKKLYVAAGVRVKLVEKKLRSGGILKDGAEVVRVSSITPHMWRHTFVRDCYLRRMPLETIADLIGDNVATVRKYYSCFDRLRQDQLRAEVTLMWSNDPITQRLQSDLSSAEALVGLTTQEPSK